MYLLGVTPSPSSKHADIYVIRGWVEGMGWVGWVGWVGCQASPDVLWEFRLHTWSCLSGINRRPTLVDWSESPDPGLSLVTKWFFWNQISWDLTPVEWAQHCNTVFQLFLVARMRAELETQNETGISKKSSVAPHRQLPKPNTNMTSAYLLWISPT